MVFGQKMRQNPYGSIVSDQIPRRHCDVVFDCIFTIFFPQTFLILSYSMSEFVKTECPLHVYENRLTFQNLQNSYHFIALANIL